MKTFKYVIQDEQGIHARPAGILVRAATEFESDIHICKDGKQGGFKTDFRSDGAVCQKGDEITVTISGKDEDAAAEKIEALFKENL